MLMLSLGRVLPRLSVLAALFLIPAHSVSVPGAVEQKLSLAGQMQFARASHTASLLPDGTVLIAGGFAGSGFESRPFASTEVFDPASGRFHPGPEMTAPRSGHAAVVLTDNRVLLAGGWSGTSGVTNTAEVYDPATRRFSRVGSMAAARGECTATLLRDGRVLVTGGVGHDERALATAEIFDPRTNAFTAATPMNAARSQHTATPLNDGRVLIAGGGSCDCGSKTVYRSAEIYDPAAGKFVPAGNLSGARYKHTAVLLADGKVLVAGGSDARDWRGLLASAELYDPSTQSFQTVPAMNSARFKLPQAAVRLANGDVFIAGGAAFPEVFRARDRVFRAGGEGFGSARYFASATVLKDGRVLVAGGYATEEGGLPATQQAWIYRP